MSNKKKRTNQHGEALKGALDIGNGECSIMTSEIDAPIGFAPVIAPMTNKRGLSQADSRPTFSLKKEERVYVVGLDDVTEHGQRDKARRESGSDRYTQSDYFDFADVLLMHGFNGMRGQSDRLTPRLAINLPVGVYNSDETVNEIRNTLVGNRDVTDFDGCLLRLNIEYKNLVVLPESTGALTHWAFDQDTLERRQGVETDGSTLVVDIGYETTDTTLYHGLKYQRDRANTVKRAGMGIIAREIADQIGEDTSRVDHALRAVAGLPLGVSKTITLPSGQYEISGVYDALVYDVSTRIVQDTKTFYELDKPRRVLVAGGGVHHLRSVLADMFKPWPVVTAPAPELANVLGSYTFLCIQEQRRG